MVGIQLLGDASHYDVDGEETNTDGYNFTLALIDDDSGRIYFDAVGPGQPFDGIEFRVDYNDLRRAIGFLEQQRRGDAREGDRNKAIMEIANKLEGSHGDGVTRALASDLRQLVR